MEFLKIDQLCKTYGKGENQVAALDHVSLSIDKGEFVAIIGASGSGKSTLLHAIAGVDVPTSGKIWLDGQDVYAQNSEKLAIFRRRQVGLIYQFHNLIPTLNVVENITLPVLMDRRPVNTQRLEELLQLLGLEQMSSESLKVTSDSDILFQTSEMQETDFLSLYERMCQTESVTSSTWQKNITYTVSGAELPEQEIPVCVQIIDDEAYYDFLAQLGRDTDAYRGENARYLAVLITADHQVCLTEQNVPLPLNGSAGQLELTAVFEATYPQDPLGSVVISLCGVACIVFAAMAFATGQLRRENILDALRDGME